LLFWPYSFVKILKWIVNLDLEVLLPRNWQVTLTKFKQLLVAPKSSETAIWVPNFSFYVVHLSFALLIFFFSFQFFRFLLLTMLYLKNGDLFLGFAKFFALNRLFCDVTVNWFLLNDNFFLFLKAYKTFNFFRQWFLDRRTN